MFFDYSEQRAEADLIGSAYASCTKELGPAFPAKSVSPSSVLKLLPPASAAKDLEVVKPDREVMQDSDDGFDFFSFRFADGPTQQETVEQDPLGHESLLDNTPAVPAEQDVLLRRCRHRPVDDYCRFGPDHACSSIRQKELLQAPRYRVKSRFVQHTTVDTWTYYSLHQEVHLPVALKKKSSLRMPFEAQPDFDEKDLAARRSWIKLTLNCTVHQEYVQTTEYYMVKPKVSKLQRSRRRARDRSYLLPDEPKPEEKKPGQGADEKELLNICMRASAKFHFLLPVRNSPIYEPASPFHAFCKKFYHTFEREILSSVSSASEITFVDIHDDVKKRFFAHCNYDVSKVSLVYHGTRSHNHVGIERRGLLVPGSQSGIKVANGSAYGIGIYTAKNASLSVGYSDCNRIYICAVLRGHQKVSDHGNIVVIFDESLVLPLFYLYYNNSFATTSTPAQIPNSLTLSNSLAFHHPRFPLVPIVQPPPPDTKDLCDGRPVASRREFQVMYRQRSKLRERGRKEQRQWKQAQRGCFVEDDEQGFNTNVILSCPSKESETEVDAEAEAEAEVAEY